MRCCSAAASTRKHPSTAMCSRLGNARAIISNDSAVILSLSLRTKLRMLVPTVRVQSASWRDKPARLKNGCCPRAELLAVNRKSVCGDLSSTTDFQVAASAMKSNLPASRSLQAGGRMMHVSATPESSAVGGQDAAASCTVRALSASASRGPCGRRRWRRLCRPLRCIVLRGRHRSWGALGRPVRRFVRVRSPVVPVAQSERRAVILLGLQHTESAQRYRERDTQSIRNPMHRWLRRSVVAQSSPSSTIYVHTCTMF